MAAQKHFYLNSENTGFYFYLFKDKKSVTFSTLGARINHILKNTENP